MTYWARPAPADGGKPQELRAHLQSVGETAARFAADIGLDPERARWAGLLHDLGKYSDEFQQHRVCLNADGSPNGAEKWGVEHACHGSSLALDAGAIETAFAIAAHHSALPDLAKLRELKTRRENSVLVRPEPSSVVGRTAELLQRALQDEAFTAGPPADPQFRDAFDAELRTRMLFSCLIDADRLDAEGWGDRWKADQRFATPLEAEKRLQSVRAFIRKTAAGSEGAANLNELRNRVLEHALDQAALPGGFFSMTVPTGGGKTLASLAFALAHAKEHGLRRVIFVIPYLSIIEQNVEVIRAAVGDRKRMAAGEPSLVLEHHSNLVDEPDGDEAKGEDGQDMASLRRRLLAENWDAPIVVTTTVQFFETLFSNRPKKARRLHNIPRSVVVFDEAQTFPPGMLVPMMRMLEQLQAEYGTTFLFCTATQPAFRAIVGANQRKREQLLRVKPREVAPDPDDLFRQLKRVDVQWPDPAAPAATVEEIARAMREAGQALAIVNTKKQARELYGALGALDPAAAVHLSTRMCAAHRLEVLDEIRRRLKAKLPCLVAATQLVEAGVDLDFPAVWRAMGPLDSIAQAAGRCNREGLLDVGRVTVFQTWDDKLPGGVYRLATEATKTMIRATGGPDIHSPRTFDEYFKRLYNLKDLDEERVQDARKALNFPAVEERFAIIDSETTPVLVPYRQGRDLIARLEADPAAESVDFADVRRMQRYSVALYTKELARAVEAGAIKTHASRLRYVDRDYDEALGLRLAGDFSEG